MNCDTFICLMDSKGFYLNPDLNLTEEKKKDKNYSSFFEVIVDSVPIGQSSEIDIPIQLKTQKYLLQEKNKIEDEIRKFSEMKRREFNELFHKLQKEKEYIFHRICQIDENTITEKTETSTRQSTDLSGSIQTKSYSSERSKSDLSLKEDIIKEEDIKEDEIKEEDVKQDELKKNYYDKSTDEEENQSEEEIEEEKIEPINLLSSSMAVNIPLKNMRLNKKNEIEEPQFSYIQRYHQFRNKFNL